MSEGAGNIPLDLKSVPDLARSAPHWGEPVPIRAASRRAIGDAGMRTEAELVAALVAQTEIPAATEASIVALTRRLATALRARGTRGPVEALMAEYALSSAEGIALMCLAEALLRTPDIATRDALIADRVGTGDWASHLGHSPSLFVNAASWGLLITGRLHAPTCGAGSAIGRGAGSVIAREEGLARALRGVIARAGQPVVRRALDIAMRLMGEQFVLGETIGQALSRARKRERRGFRYSYDMLGEGAVTAADADRYMDEYRRAIAAIGDAAFGPDIASRPGISIKLSALHPRYERAQSARVLAELGPRLLELARDAAARRIGLNIDAEEADRLELSLDLFDIVCNDAQIPRDAGIGFVVQAYGKRATAVIDHLIALGRSTGRRLMLRLVKGAYWDSEIKHAQVLGFDGFPVFTRRDHTDLSYIACAIRMLAAPDAIYSQFATHNARTVATIHALAGEADYEFQCLHGMGEGLYEEVVGADKLDRPCRVYAPVGTHETLLAYLVRRLLENGANTSFVNRIADPAVSIDELASDPRARVLARVPFGAPHEAIALPREILSDGRVNARGYELGSEPVRADIVAALNRPPAAIGDERGTGIRNPADPDDVVGRVDFAPDDATDILDLHIAAATAAAPAWRDAGGAARAIALLAAADLLETRALDLVGILAREAGKTVPNGLGEIREAIDFLRYYAHGTDALEGATTSPLGVVCCISPWNFPLAIFVGQIACALAAGNAVIAKPAEETPLIASIAIALLHEAGVPPGALRLVQGGGACGASLVAHQGVDGVMFTGSTDAARAIARSLAARTASHGRPIPLIAETGGQNAMVVCSSALAEQVVADVVASAFDSAGQRCSALRVLCLQDEIADRMIAMLKGAMEELTLGDPRLLATDIGPVIGQAQAAALEAHVDAMASLGMRVHRAPRAIGLRGWFVAPALIEIDRIERLQGEVFGPVLHVVRWRRTELASLLAAIEATGYALTFGVHTRLDDVVARAIAGTTAGNVYVNRNMVGAVVGVQPFGGGGLSGTGPKAGGPLALQRLRAGATDPGRELTAEAKAEAEAEAEAGALPPPRATAFARIARECGHDPHDRVRTIVAHSPLRADRLLAGPVGETNIYRLEGRGAVLCVARHADAAIVQIACVLAAGGEAVVDHDFPCPAALADFVRVSGAIANEPIACALFEGDTHALGTFAEALAARSGPIVPLHALGADDIDAGAFYPVAFLMRERVISTNTAAAGGNATLMAIG